MIGACVVVLGVAAAADRQPARCFPLPAISICRGGGCSPASVSASSRGCSRALLTGLLYKMEDLFGRIPLHWMWWPAIGGLAVGLGGLIEPRALGVGYDIIGDLLTGHICFGGGRDPAGEIGDLDYRAGVGHLRRRAGAAVDLRWLRSAGSRASTCRVIIGAWALIGMAAMMGGTMRSPLTAILFAIELTGDFALLGPLLIATSAAFALTVLLLKRSILTEKIARRGQHVVREYSIDPFELTARQRRHGARRRYPAGCNAGRRGDGVFHSETRAAQILSADR